MERVFLADQAVLGKLSPQLVAERNLKIPVIKRTDYLPEYDKSVFLIPFNRIREKDESAVISLIVATTVDGLALLLATAIDPRKSNIFRVVSNGLHFCIVNFRIACLTVYKGFGRGVEMFDVMEEESLHEITRLTLTLDASGTSGMRGTVFLRKFYAAVDMHTRFINIHELMEKEKNPTVQYAYRLLFDKICHHPSNWIEVTEESHNKNNNPQGKVKKQYKISERHYKSFVNWIARAIREQAERESGNPEIRGIIEISLPF
jgi:hypothetical protein